MVFTNGLKKGSWPGRYILSVNDDDLQGTFAKELAIFVKSLKKEKK